MPPTLPAPRRRAPRERHPLVYLAALSLLFSVIAFFGRFAMLSVVAGALAAVLMAAGAIFIVLRAR